MYLKLPQIKNKPNPKLASRKKKKFMVEIKEMETKKSMKNQ
jgi:hypothetical protein